MEFRALRRTKNAITIEAAKDLLQQEKRAVLAVNGDNGYPYAIPINYYYDREAGKIYFHGAKSGHKAEALQRCDKVCLTVYGNERPVEGDWAPTLQSTVVFGRCAVMEKNAEAFDKLRTMALRYYPTAAEVDAEIQSSGNAVQIFEITIEHICGKQIKEK